MQEIPDTASMLRLKNYALNPVLRAARDAAGHTGSRIYLVGGALRDALLGRARADDLDIVICGKYEAYAERLARMLRGRRIPWEFRQSRIAYTAKGRGAHIDIADCKGAAIEEDLAERDFTVNAVALDLEALVDRGDAALIDPLGGLQDLRQKTLRLCSSRAFDDDPLRLLRALRIARVTGCAIHAETSALMRSKHRLIERVASERLKRELFAVLGAPRPEQSLREARATGVLMAVMPELGGIDALHQGPPHDHDVLEHSLRTVGGLDELSAGAAAVNPGLSRKLQEHMMSMIEEGVSRRSLLMCAALLHDCGKAETRTAEPDGRTHFRGHAGPGSRKAEAIARRLGLGRQASRIVRRSVDLHMRVLQLCLGRPATERAKTRLLLDAGDAAPELMLLAMADARATSLHAAYAAARERVDALAMELLERALQPEEAPGPRELVSGADVMDVLGIQAGPHVGEILGRLRGHERAGRIQTRREALQWLRQQKPSA